MDMLVIRNLTYAMTGGQPVEHAHRGDLATSPYGVFRAILKLQMAELPAPSWRAGPPRKTTQPVR
jgi:hypothetical protein